MFDPRYSVLTPGNMARFIRDFEGFLIYYSKAKHREAFPSQGEAASLADLYAAALAELDDMWEVKEGRPRHDYAV